MSASSHHPPADFDLQQVQVRLAAEQDHPFLRELFEESVIEGLVGDNDTGADACAALRLAQRILDSLRGHAWNGTAAGPVGPQDLPTPHGPLFAHMPQKDAA